MPRNKFFFYIHVFLLLVVLVGFAPSFYLRPFSEQAPLPFHLILHGVACTVWFFSIFLQSLWIQNNNVSMHRNWGHYFAAWSLLVVFTGLWVMYYRIDNFISENYSIQGELASRVFESMLIWGDILVLLSFLTFVYLGYYHRKRVEFHKRYLLYASLMIVQQAFIRLGKLDFFRIAEDPGKSGSMYAFLGPVLMLLALLIYDKVQFKKIHKASWICIISYLALLLSAVINMRTGIGMNLLEILW